MNLFDMRSPITINFIVHIDFLCGLDEICACVSPNFLLQKMIYHTVHICNIDSLYEICGCVSLNTLY